MQVVLLGFFFFLCIVYFGLIYNSLVSKKNQLANVESSTEVLLLKRWDLIPNLISTVKGYTDHEESVFEKIAELRSKVVYGRLSSDQLFESDNHVSTYINSILLSAENYPVLKASENFLHLQRTLFEIEEQISAARRAYQASITDYNNAVQQFPSNIVANIMNYKPKDRLLIAAYQRNSHQLNFSSEVEKKHEKY